MAFMNQDRKRELAPGIKDVFKKYGVKGTIGVRNNSTLVVKLRSGKIDFIGDIVANRPSEQEIRYIQVNPYWYSTHFNGQSLDFLQELFSAMNNGNWDKSDVQVDYFNVGWHTDVQIGEFNKPYKLET